TRAAPGLRSARGLAWRLQRTVLLTWLVGLTAMGAAFGSVTGSVEDVVAENDEMLAVLSRLAPGATVTDLYLGFVMALLAIAVGAYTVQGLQRMRAEEATGRLEPVLASATGRTRWMGGHLVLVAGGTLAVLTTTGLAAGLTHAVATGRGVDAVLEPVVGAWAQAPAVLALAGVVVALFGLLPRAGGPAAWALLGAALVMGQLGALLDLPGWALNLSPFTHVPLVPAEDLTAAPVLWLLAVAAGTTALGVATFRHRDLAIPA
ncbi:ABC transporter permease, partial [Cellulomonas bogoriensis 69B4 = DSM 16987]